MSWGKLLLRPIARQVGRRNVSYGHHGPQSTYNDLPSPQGSWKTHYDANQRKYTGQLIMGVGIFAGTLLFGEASGMFKFYNDIPEKPAVISSYNNTSSCDPNLNTKMNVEVRPSSTAKGKGLFATKAIPSGTVILEEDPLVSCQFAWNEQYLYKACNHCLRPLETAEENARRLTGIPTLELPYPECCTTDKSKIVSCSLCGKEYCCVECLTAAYIQYHQILCTQSPQMSNAHPLEQLMETWKNMHFPPETNSIMLIVRLLARILQAPNREAAIEQTLSFCHRTVNEDADLAHKLLGEKFAPQQSLLHNLLLTCLPHEGIEQFLTVAGFQGLLALIGTNGQGVGTSAISQWVTRTSELPLSDSEREVLDKFIDKLYEDMDAHSGTFLNNEGVALYSLQSACNHSCTPNAEANYLHNNNRLSLVALKDIQEGEEIFISYLDECNLERSRHSRRKVLMDNYLFMCECPKCIQEADTQADETSEEEPDSS